MKRKPARRITAQGYMLMYAPYHPNLNTKDGYVLEHRLVMERKLKRFLLPSEVVHHIDEQKTNNNISNLLLFKNGREHTIHHMKLNGVICNTKTVEENRKKRAEYRTLRYIKNKDRLIQEQRERRIQMRIKGGK